MNFDVIRSLISVIVIVVILLVFVTKLKPKKSVITTKFIAKTAIFSAISIILYCVPVLKFALPFFPSFLEIHLDEIPAMIGAFAYGPVCGFFIILIKTIVKLPMSTSACVGELADLIYSTAFIIPACLIYKKIRKFKGALISLLIGTIIQIAVSSILTTYIMLDIYAILYPGLTREVILSICQAINPAVSDLGLPFLFMVCVPFNALKDGIVVALTLILYKKLHLLLDKMDR